MSIVLRMVFLFSLWAVSGPEVFSFAASPSAINSINLGIEQHSYELGPYLEIMEDKAGNWTIDDVSRDIRSHEFKKIGTRALTLGLTESVYWIRFAAHKKSTAAHFSKKFLRLDRCDLYSSKFYIPQSSLDIATTSQAWREIDWKKPPRGGHQKGMICNQITFPLPTMSKTPTVFYLRLHHPFGTFYFDLALVTEQGKSSSIKQKSIWMGVYYGVLIAMILFNLHIYVALREKTQCIYLFYILSAGMFFICNNGIIFEYVDSEKLHFQLKVFCMGLTMLLSCAFSRSFLNIKRYSQTLEKAFLIVMLTLAGVIVSIPLASPMFINQMLSITGFIVPVMILGTGVLCLRRGFQPVFFFLVAWTFLLIGGMIFVMAYRGILPYTDFTINSLQIGSGFEVVILSFALGQRIRALRKERDLTRRIFGKYVSDKVCDEILNGHISFDGETKEVTVLIADLRDYTPLAESMSPKSLVRITNAYFEAMAETIEQFNGVVLRYAGDSIQAVFGAPLPVDDHPKMAVKAALEMRKQLDRVNKKLTSEGAVKLRHGIGIASGKVTAGNIGSPDRLTYSLSGITVNLAARIEELTKKFNVDILVSEATMSHISNQIKVDNLGETRIKGLTKSQSVYKVV